MKTVTILLATFLFAAFVGANAAPVLVGKITDTEGHSLPAVSITTNLRGIGSVSDSNGEFLLTTDDQVTRVTFSSVGFKPRQFLIGEVPKVVILSPMFIRGEDIIVTADRAQTGISSVAFENLSSDELERDYSVGELPLLLESTPNLYAYSDAGNSLGYSYMRIRGFDDKRVSTYINGVPLNDPEDHATYFVDLPDFAANVDDIQVQRGIGNSLYGDASFGGSVNIVTSLFSRPRQTVLTTGYGEYTSDGKSISDMYKQSVEYASGLIDGRWSFAGRFSKQKSGGYRYGSWYEGWSYYFAMGRVDPKMTTELYVYGGPMRMHLAFYGAGRDAIDADRRANPYLTYDNETDNFNQPHYHLHNSYRLSETMTLSNTLYYIRGKGYYEQFKSKADFFDYNLSNLSDSASGNLVRQQWVEKNQYGWNPSLVIEHDRGSHSLGGSFYYFNSEHWGAVPRAEYLDNLNNGSVKYYEYFGTKQVGSVHVQEYYRLSERLSTQITAQLRWQDYQFDQTRMGAFAGYSYDLNNLFFSPRLGLNYDLSEAADLYLNLSLSSRTPTDGAIYDANNPNRLPSLEILDQTISASGETVTTFGDPLVKPERVHSYEMGISLAGENRRGTINLFYMDFRDEIVSYAYIDYLIHSYNIERSVHSGIELSGSYRANVGLTLSGNFAYNRNRVIRHSRLVDGINVDFADKQIAGFPDYLGSLIADYQLSDFRLTYRFRFVGQQYMEMYNIDDIAVESYNLSSLSVSYQFGDVAGIGKLTLSGRIDNLFDTKYESFGYGDNYAYNDGSKDVVEGWAEYFVGAERSFWGQLKIELF
ncbi:MAG: TonB-dependent receptor [bacterium]|nr:TonB-dependent receptor [bacterium]